MLLLDIIQRLRWSYYECYISFFYTQELADFVPVEKRKDLVETYEKSKIKGAAYVKWRVTDSEEEVHEVFRAKYREVKR